MNYLTHLKRTKMHYKSRWVVKYNKNDSIREVKLIFNPEEYSKSENAKPMYGDRKLKEILVKDKEKRNEK